MLTEESARMLQKLVEMDRLLPPGEKLDDKLRSLRAAKVRTEAEPIKPAAPAEVK